MLLKPRFRSSLDLHVVGTTLFLLDEHHQFLLEGQPYCLLAPLLDGQRGISDIERDCKGQLSLPKIFFFLSQLEQRGFLVEGENSPPDAARAFSEYFRWGNLAAPADPSIRRVQLEAIGNTPLLPFENAFREQGFEVDGGEGSLLVVATDDYLRPELAEINARALAANRPWMLVKPVGMLLWIGPILEPGTTGCWRCLYQRLESNRQTEKYIQDHRTPPTLVVTAQASLPSSLDLAAGTTVTAVTEWFDRPVGANLRGKMASIDLVTFAMRHHDLVKRPQCPDCGDSSIIATQGLRPVALESHAKRFQDDGGHRTATPEETYKKYQHHISPYLGAVTELIPAIGPWTELTPCYIAGHNFSMGLDSLVFLRESVRGVSGGKGASPAQAKASALCEALERYSGRYHGDEYSRRGTFDSIQGAIHPNDCMGFSEEQFRIRDEWNATRSLGSRCQMVPNPFDPKLEVDWSPLWSLTSGETRYLPTAYCFYGHPEFPQGRWCFPDSNGTAAGNTVEEAILQGYFELVERDAVAIWWYNRIPRRAVDIDSFGLPYLRAIWDYYVRLKREIWVIDITSDLNVSTFACISRRTDRPVEDILLGFGSHFDPKIAILRAVTEVNQFLPSVAATNPDGSTRYVFWDALARQWWSGARLADNPYLAPDPTQRPAQLSDFINPSASDLRADVQTCIDISARNGMEMLVMDQTRPDIGLSVVKVVVPQLCHFWRRLGKPRLYDVPVAQGWLKEPTPVGQLNPHSIFF